MRVVLYAIEYWPQMDIILVLLLLNSYHHLLSQKLRKSGDIS
jgi:hypothetical protein